MMLYVIPFILLLVIAIVLKKRGASSKEPKTSSKDKASAKKASKKTAKSGTPATDDVIQINASAAAKSTPLAADLRQKIENLIQVRNFFAAEAQINQALNRDSSQHDLYLLLLDIHIQQKDEFAINQLMGQLQTLGLDDILQQAEVKQQAYQQKKEAEAAVQATLASQPVVSGQPDFTPSTSAPVNTARSEDFDALVKPAESTSSFEQIQAELAPAKKEPAIEVAPLEFNLSGAPQAEEVAAVAAPVVQEQAVDLSKALDFTLESPAVAAAPVVETPVEPVALDVKTAEPQPLEFAFTLAPTETAEVETAQTPVAVESAPVIAEAEPAVEAKATPDFSMDFPSFETSTATNTASEVSTAPESNTETAPAIPLTLEFNLDTPAVSSPAVETTPVLELEPAITAAAEQPVPEQQHDPLAQSFPELLQVNEISLNLELAQQYIKLGAYDSARRLLSENAAQFSQEQREQSELLLKQLAS